MIPDHESSRFLSNVDLYAPDFRASNPGRHYGYKKEQITTFPENIPSFCRTW
jgi:hypothetical protein